MPKKGISGVASEPTNISFIVTEIPPATAEILGREAVDHNLRCAAYAGLLLQGIVEAKRTGPPEFKAWWDEFMQANVDPKNRGQK